MKRAVTITEQRIYVVFVDDDTDDVEDAAIRAHLEGQSLCVTSARDVVVNDVEVIDG